MPKLQVEFDIHFAGRQGQIPFCHGHPERSSATACWLTKFDKGAPAVRSLQLRAGRRRAGASLISGCVMNTVKVAYLRMGIIGSPACFVDCRRPRAAQVLETQLETLRQERRRCEALTRLPCHDKDFRRKATTSAVSLHFKYVMDHMDSITGSPDRAAHGTVTIRQALSGKRFTAGKGVGEECPQTAQGPRLDPRRICREAQRRSAGHQSP